VAALDEAPVKRIGAAISATPDRNEIDLAPRAIGLFFQPLRDDVVVDGEGLRARTRIALRLLAEWLSTGEPYRSQAVFIDRRCDLRYGLPRSLSQRRGVKADQATPSQTRNINRLSRPSGSADLMS